MPSGSLMPDRFEVAGLIAERLDANHLTGLCRLDSDPLVMATLGGPRSTATTAEHLGYDMQRWEEHGVGMYALVSASAGLVGRAGLRSKILGERHETEVAYSLLPAWWGNGIATAVVCRLVKLAESRRVSDSLVATVTSGNPASVRVLQKTAFEFEADIQRDGEAMALDRRTLNAG